MIISGIYDFGASLIYDVINTSAVDVDIGGRRWLRIGGILVYADSPGDTVLIQWSFIATTPSPHTTPLPGTVGDIYFFIGELQPTASLKIFSQTKALQ